MPDEIKRDITEQTTTDNEKKDADVDSIVKSLFNRKPDEKNEHQNKKVKAPVNIFSKPIPLTQDDEAKRARLKVVVIEALLFSAFLTSITLIFSLSGLEAKLDPEHGLNIPSIWFFLVEFVVFSIFFGVGDYFLTEHRVNLYNSSVAGINTNLNSEISDALKEQEAEGITPDIAASQNKSNGEEAFVIDVRCSNGADSHTNKVFEAYIGEEKVGFASTRKGIILDSNGFQNIVLVVSSLSAAEGDFKNGVVMHLLDAVKGAAAENLFPAVVIPKSVYGDFVLNLFGGDKYKISYLEEIKISESFPGSLMGISGELK